MHSKLVSVWRRTLSSAAPSVDSASNTGITTEKVGATFVRLWDSDSPELCLGIQPFQVIHVAGHYDRLLVFGREHDGCIDDVRRSRFAAQNACSFREDPVERYDRRRSTMEQRAERDLPRAIT